MVSRSSRITKIPTQRAEETPEPNLGFDASRTILVVDDNRDATETLALLLRQAGYRVFIAVDGEGAIESITRLQPDIVILDIGLPGMDGFEVAERLRAAPPAHVPTLVAISGYGQDEDRRRAKKAGFDQYFTKPVGIDDLRAYLSRVPPRPR